MKTKLVLGLSISLFSISGCAYVTAVPAPPGSEVRGIRVPDVKPLLVVTGGQVQVITVPNPNRAYALQFGSFLAKHDLEADFSNGFIQKLKSNQDSTAFSVELLKSLTEAQKTPGGIFDGFSKNGGSGAANDLQVYDIVFDSAGNLVGLRPLITKNNIEPWAQAIAPPVTGQSSDTGGQDSIDLN